MKVSPSRKVTTRFKVQVSQRIKMQKQTDNNAL